MLRTLMKQSALQIPPIRRLKDEVDFLRQREASQGSERESVASLSAERDALRNEVRRLRSQIDGLARKPAAAVAADDSPRSRQDCFTDEIVDLREINPKHAGVVSPRGEIGRPLMGITETLLSGAEEYFKKYQQYGYIFGLLSKQLDLLGKTPSGIAVDIGSGFGNTVIPILEHYRDLRVIATDLSPDLLAILRREADQRGVGDRCLAVAMDSQRNYFQEGFADIVFGCAVLHHLVDPESAVRAALTVLRPGGHAIFLEPFETGNSILRLAYLEIMEETKRRGEKHASIDFLEGMYWDITIRTHKGHFHDWPGKWEDLDDKVLFTRTFFERLRDSVGASDLQIRPLHGIDKPFTAQTVVNLSSYGGFKCPDDLPQWGWDILKRYDEDAFSADMRSELILEGAVIITK